MKKTCKPQKIKLTEDQSKKIRNTFERHKINIQDRAFTRLISDVEKHLADWESLQFGEEKPTSRTQVESEIENLRSALSGLSESSIVLLINGCFYTDLHKRFANGGLEIDRSVFPEWKSSISLPLYAAIYYQLIEACELVLSKNPPKYSARASIVDFCTNTKIGHPRHAKSSIQLCISLADSFEQWTKKKASDTPGGAFDEFLSFCRQIVEPKCGEKGQTSKRLIRASLAKYNPQSDDWKAILPATK